jgi:hypothetical protein
MPPIRRLVRTLSAILLVAAPMGCGGATNPDPLVGTWLATTLLIAPAGRAPTNALAAGGTLGLNVANNFVTAGTLILPPSVTGGATLTVSLAGTAVRTDNTVRFSPTADSFMRGLTFTLADNLLQATSQVVADTTYTLVLTRQ